MNTPSTGSEALTRVKVGLRDKFEAAACASIAVFTVAMFGGAIGKGIIPLPNALPDALRVVLNPIGVDPKYFISLLFCALGLNVGFRIYKHLAIGLAIGSATGGTGQVWVKPSPKGPT